MNKGYLLHSSTHQQQQSHPWSCLIKCLMTHVYDWSEKYLVGKVQITICQRLKMDKMRTFKLKIIHSFLMTVFSFVNVQNTKGRLIQTGGSA